MTTHRTGRDQSALSRWTFPAIYALCGASFVLVLFTAGAFAGSDLQHFVGIGGGGYESRMSAAIDIAGRNFSVVLALLSGIVTFGVTSVVIILVISIYSGVLAHVALEAFGASWWWQYFPFAAVELTGFTIAALVGLYPVAAVIRHQLISRRGDAPAQRPTRERIVAPARLYWSSMRVAVPAAVLALLITALALLLEVGFAVRIR